MAKNNRGGNVGAGTADYSAQARKILNPSQRQDYIDRAELIGQISENSSYKYDVSVSEWQNYGKDRTYIKLNQYYSSDGTLRQSIDMGYFDNVKNEYVKGRTKNSDSMQGNLWDLQGSQKYTESDIAEFLKKKKK